MKTLKRSISLVVCLILFASCSTNIKKIDWGLEKDNFSSYDQFMSYDPFIRNQDTVFYKGEAFTGELFGEFTIDGEGHFNDEVIIKFKYNFKDGLLNGLFERYYENNQLMEVSNYKDGKEDGISEAYNQKGQLENKTNYKDGEDTGDSFHNNGQLKSRLKDGIKEEYYENGQLQGKGPYMGVGKFEMYYENGQLMGKINIDKNGKPEWLKGSEAYYENGQLSYKINKNGDFEKYDERGLLMEKGNIKNEDLLDLMKNMKIN